MEGSDVDKFERTYDLNSPIILLFTGQNNLVGERKDCKFLGKMSFHHILLISYSTLYGKYIHFKNKNTQTFTHVITKVGYLMYNLKL